jgi:hypothetical protein
VGYYGSGRGDYYRGDYYRAGGIFGSIGKFLGGVAKTAANVLSVLPTPLAPLARVATAVLNPRQGTAIAPFAPAQNPVLVQSPRLPSLGPISTGQIGPFGQQTGGLIQVQAYTAGGRQVTKVVDQNTGRVVSGRKRMNVANPRALRRALRRVAGFGKLAKRAKRDIARAASAIGVRRGGGSSRGVITRSEAARALRK